MYSAAKEKSQIAEVISVGPGGNIDSNNIQIPFTINGVFTFNNVSEISFNRINIKIT